MGHQENKVGLVIRELDAIAKLTAPQNPQVTLDIQPDIDGWLFGIPELPERSHVDILNNAFGAAAWRQLAFKFGAQIISTTLTEAQTAVPVQLPQELPLMRFFDPEADLTRLEDLNMTPRNWRFLQWTKEDRGLTPEVAMDDGLRLISHMSTLGHCALTIYDGGRSRSTSLSILFSDLPPLPPISTPTT